MPANDDRRDDIQSLLDEIHIELCMARNGAAYAQSETSDRSVRYAVIAIREHLKRVDEITQELEKAFTEAVDPEPARPEPARSSRSHLRGRRD